MTYRNLDLGEIAQLEYQGCTAVRWHDVKVKDPFYTDRFTNVQFSGEVQLGVFDESIDLPGNVERPCGIRNAAIHHCTIGDNVYIANVPNLANYVIENKVVVDNVSSLVVQGPTTFGNGVKIEVLNEGGGRELPIYERLSAQIAYLLVVYRHRPGMLKQLEQMIGQYTASRRASVGKLGAGCRISNCGKLLNVNVGPVAEVDGAALLQEGTICSCAEDPAVVGQGVTARNFIMQSGAHVEDGVVLSRCFIGQGVRMGKQYSAENSAFFANCEGFHGEACSIFAGPYTVTHHKSTLLIAGLFSFYNAGSGSNQSNHMYKLGPVHQGILERGTKTGSFSYMLWPCRVGPFSVVLEKHHANFDTSNLPFSYLTVEGAKTIVTPAMNLFTVGTCRDAAKWPKRDRRKDPDKLDQLSFEVLSPYMMSRIVTGIDELTQLGQKAKKEQTEVPYKGAWIKRLMLSTGAKYYDMAVKIFVGDCLVRFLDDYDGEDAMDALLHNLEHHATDELEQWVDVSGLLTTMHRMDELVNEIETGVVEDAEELLSIFRNLVTHYREDEWRWCCALLKRQLGAITAEAVLKMIDDWKTCRTKLNNMILQDAAKEFDATAQIGFGLDGDAADKAADFAAVRGTKEENSFIRGIQEEIAAVTKRAEQLLERLRHDGAVTV